MASRSFLRSAKRPDLYVCARCALRGLQTPSNVTKRWIGMKYLMKVADAELEWQEKATRIKAGKEKSMLTILEERGLIQTITGSRDALDELLTDRRVGAYVGIDPTAASLHIGHLIPLMSLFWMYLHGFHTISLLGGATSKIGDPTDRLTTREKQHPALRTANMVRMHMQLKKLWVNVEAYGRKHGYEKTWAWHRELVNNNVWWNKQPMLEVLQIMGPGVRLGSMLARDTVKNKMSKGDGMSFAEFTYPVMQAWDWWHMFRKKGIRLQIGGSDQFGNITAGIDAIKYVSANHPEELARSEAKAVGEPVGFTVPLLTSASGQKFGKSAGNAIWLDNEETTAFQLYAYLLKASDTDVERYLKMFTFLPLETISCLMGRHRADPSKRIAQHKLAYEFLELVHGEHEAKIASNQHQLLHQKGPGEPLPSEMDADAKAGIVTLNNRPQANIKLPRAWVFQSSLPKLIQSLGFTAKRAEAHRLIQAGGAYVGGRNPGTGGSEMTDASIHWLAIKEEWKGSNLDRLVIHDNLLLFRKGKADIRIVQIVPDEEYALSGEKYPYMDPAWRKKILEGMAAREAASEDEQAAIAELLKGHDAWAKDLVGDVDEDLAQTKPQRQPKIRHISTDKGGVQSVPWRQEGSKEGLE